MRDSYEICPQFTCPHCGEFWTHVSRLVFSFGALHEHTLWEHTHMHAWICASLWEQIDVYCISVCGIQSYQLSCVAVICYYIDLADLAVNICTAFWLSRKRERERERQRGIETKREREGVVVEALLRGQQCFISHPGDHSCQGFLNFHQTKHRRRYFFVQDLKGFEALLPECLGQNSWLAGFNMISSLYALNDHMQQP